MKKKKTFIVVMLTLASLFAFNITSNSLGLSNRNQWIGVGILTNPLINPLIKEDGGGGVNGLIQAGGAATVVLIEPGHGAGNIWDAISSPSTTELD